MPRPRAKTRNIPPDPSRPDMLSDAIKQQIDLYLREPLNYPPEMVSWFTSFIGLNPIQSTTA